MDVFVGLFPPENKTLEKRAGQEKEKKKHNGSITATTLYVKTIEVIMYENQLIGLAKIEFLRSSRPGRVVWQATFPNCCRALMNNETKQLLIFLFIPPKDSKLLRRSVLRNLLFHRVEDTRKSHEPY